MSRIVDRWSVAGIIAFTCATASATQAQLPPTDPADQSQHANEVRLLLSGRRLSDAMAELARRSGTRILVSPSLVDLKVDGMFESADWHALMRNLLRRFDHLAIVDREGRFLKVWITAKKDPKTVASDVRTTAGGVSASAHAGNESESFAELPQPIWEVMESTSPDEETENGIGRAPVRMNPDFIERFRVGQPIEIPIPQEGRSFFGVVGETHEQLNGEVSVWSGPVDGLHDSASFTVTHGQKTTYVTVATGNRIFEVTLDNLTGLGRVVDEADLTRGKTGKDFVIPDARKDR